MFELPENIKFIDVTEDVEDNEHGYLFKGNNPKFDKKLFDVLRG